MDMKLTKKNPDLKEQIAYVMSADPRTMDDDHLLCVVIWHNALKQEGFDIMNTSAYHFMQMYRDKKLPNHDTVTRIRRKLQEEHVELRGKKYVERQLKQNEVKKDLGYGDKV